MYERSEKNSILNLDFGQKKRLTSFFLYKQVCNKESIFFSGQS